MKYGRRRDVAEGVDGLLLAVGVLMLIRGSR
jgi:hypothetical protein